MLGRRIFDPCGVESEYREVDGLGLLDIETDFADIKTTSQVEATINNFRFKEEEQSEIGGLKLSGYEIHMGTSRGDIGLFRLERQPGNGNAIMDGSMKGNCWGTYIHGIFDHDEFRRAVINDLRRKKNLPQLEGGANYASLKDRAIDGIASLVKENLDMNYVDGLLNL